MNTKVWKRLVLATIVDFFILIMSLGVIFIINFFLPSIDEDLNGLISSLFLDAFTIFLFL